MYRSIWHHSFFFTFGGKACIKRFQILIFSIMKYHTLSSVSLDGSSHSSVVLLTYLIWPELDLNLFDFLGLDHPFTVGLIAKPIHLADKSAMPNRLKTLLTSRKSYVVTWFIEVQYLVICRTGFSMRCRYRKPYWINRIIPNLSDTSRVFCYLAHCSQYY